MKYLLMHQTTWDFIKENFSTVKIPYQIETDGKNISLSGYEVRIVNSLNPTIDERGWMFPEDRFITWEKKDEVWARKLGYGREGRGLLLGQIIEMHGETIHPKTLEMKTSLDTRTIFNPERFGKTHERPRTRLNHGYKL